jgi:dCTP deaminase
MILCDNEIRAALELGALVITPPPTPDKIKPSAVDLRLGREFRQWQTGVAGATLTLDPGSDGFNYMEVARTYTREVPLSADGTITVEPKALVLGITEERVELPAKHRLAARVEGRSTLGRIGLTVHVTAPTIHTSFRGPITLEIVNLNALPIKLRPGMAICQLIIEHVFGTPASELKSVFQDQTSVLGRK